MRNVLDIVYRYSDKNKKRQFFNIFFNSSYIIPKHIQNCYNKILILITLAYVSIFY